MHYNEKSQLCKRNVPFNREKASSKEITYPENQGTFKIQAIINYRLTIKTTFEGIKAFKINAKNYLQKKKENKKKTITI